MDPIENFINVSMANAEKTHDQSCSELLKSLIALNQQNGNSIDETAIATVVSNFWVKHVLQVFLILFFCRLKSTKIVCQNICKWFRLILKHA